MWLETATLGPARRECRRQPCVAAFTAFASAWKNWQCLSGSETNSADIPCISMTEEAENAAPPEESEETIVRYLLGEMSDEDRSRMEERLAHEPSFFYLVASVEDDLIMQFVRGELDSHKLSRFNEVYMNAPSKQARVESARALRQAVREIAGGRGPLGKNLGRLV